MTFRNNVNQTALPIRTWGAFMPPNGVGGGGVHWNAETWRFLPQDFSSVRISRSATARISCPQDMTIQDWGVTYDDLEPYYDKFEYLCGTSGKAGNIKGEKQAGGNPFEGPRSRDYPTPAQKQPYGPSVLGKGRRGLGISSIPAAFRQSVRRPTPIRSASRWGRAPIAASASGSAAAIIPRRARRPRCCRC